MQRLGKHRDEKKNRVRARKVLHHGVGDFGLVAMEKGKVGSSCKKSIRVEQRAKKAVRIPDARLIGTLTSSLCSSTQSLCVRNIKVRSQVVGID